MATTETCESTDVLIVGCGPTGALLAGLLGQFQISNIILEKQATIPQDPRGIALDEDGIRLLQAVGIYDEVHTEMASCLGYMNFIDGKHDLYAKPFMRINCYTTAGNTGHVAAIGHRQPIMEKYLRLAAVRQGYSQIRTSCTLTRIEENSDWVVCQYADESGVERRIRAKFLVGADGKTGFTRKKYLEPRGVKMEQASNFLYEETWVALNWRITPPTKETHPDFPLFKLGYAPEETYDAFFPKDFRFICDPDRPAVSSQYINTEEATFIVQAPEVRGQYPKIGTTDVYRLATAAEFSRSPLCVGRPEPQFYDMYRMRRDLGRKRFAVVRPDRFLYAACDTPHELASICAGVQRMLEERS